MTKSKLSKIREIKTERMRALKRIKKESKKSTKQKVKVQTNHFSSKSNFIIDEILRGTSGNDKCVHFKVGSSSLHSFFKGKYNFKRAHAKSQTTAENQITGIAGEEAFIRSGFPIDMKHPFGHHKSIPFICSTADFLIEGPNKELCATVEVKTFTDAENCKQMYLKIPHRVLIQLWIQLEVFGLINGELRIYFLNRDKKLVELFGVVKLLRTAKFFDENLTALAVYRYIIFFKEYLKKHKYFPSEKYFGELTHRLYNLFWKNILMDPFSDSRIRSHIMRIPYERDCPFWTETYSHTRDPTCEFEPYETMFSKHQFNSTSKLKKNLELNEEVREEIWNKIIEKLTPNDFEELKKINEKIKERPKKIAIDSKQKKSIEKRSKDQKYINENAEIKMRISELESEFKKLQIKNKILKSKIKKYREIISNSKKDDIKTRGSIMSFCSSPKNKNYEKIEFILNKKQEKQGRMKKMISERLIKENE